MAMVMMRFVAMLQLVSQCTCMCQRGIHLSLYINRSEHPRNYRYVPSCHAPQRLDASVRVALALQQPLSCVGDLLMLAM
jgi:hypothetical protein